MATGKRKDINELIARSSLGTEGAKRLRRRVSDAAVRSVLDKVEPAVGSPSPALPSEIIKVTVKGRRRRHTPMPAKNELRAMINKAAPRYTYRFRLDFVPGVTKAVAQAGLKRVASQIIAAGGRVDAIQVYDTVSVFRTNKLKGHQTRLGGVLVSKLTIEQSKAIEAVMARSDSVQRVERAQLTRDDVVEIVAHAAGKSKHLPTLLGSVDASRSSTRSARTDVSQE